MLKMREVGQRRIEELEAMLAKAVGTLVVTYCSLPQKAWSMAIHSPILRKLFQRQPNSVTRRPS